MTSWGTAPRDHRGHRRPGRRRKHRDDLHTSCAAFLEQTSEPLIVPSMAITEVCYMLARRRNHGSPELAAVFLDNLGGEGLKVEQVTDADIARIAVLLRRYADLPLDAVDAAVVAIAERLGATKVATIDRKDFRVVAPASGKPFELLPTDLG